MADNLFKSGGKQKPTSANSMLRGDSQHHSCDPQRRGRLAGVLQVDQANCSNGQIVASFKADIEISPAAKSQAKARARHLTEGRKQINLVAPIEAHDLLRQTAKFFSECKVEPEVDVVTKDTLRQLIKIFEEKLDSMLT